MVELVRLDSNLSHELNEKQMIEITLLLNTYYEALYERLETRKGLLTTRVEKLLKQEIAKRKLGDFDTEKYEAYRDACLAFVDERIETYNPIGIQYIFDSSRRREAFELELQLNWYDSRAEFKALTKAAQEKADSPMSDKDVRKLVDELINEVGAFPDKSIISTYEAEPALGKLPDYVVACAIEEIIR